MSTLPQRPCATCNKLLDFWWQCPDKICHLDIAYCDEHGGDERAREEMRVHIEKTRLALERMQALNSRIGPDIDSKAEVLTAVAHAVLDAGGKS